MSTFLTYHRNPEFFKLRFGREAKRWSIEQIHDLWLRACERGNVRRKELCDYIQEIVKEITADDRGYHKVYFTHRKRPDGVCYYSFKYEPMFKSHSYSNNDFKIETRDDKLVSMLGGKPFEMGQKFHELEGMSTSLQHRVKHIMWTLIEDQLREKFKNEIPSSVFIIKIGNKRYNVIPKERYSYYHTFELCDEVDDKEIEIT